MFIYLYHVEYQIASDSTKKQFTSPGPLDQQSDWKNRVVARSTDRLIAGINQYEQI